MTDYDRRRVLYKGVLAMYRDIMAGSEKRRIEKDVFLSNARALQLVLQAVVSLEQMEDSVKHKTVLRKIGTSIAKLDGFDADDDGPRNKQRKSSLLYAVERWNRDDSTYT